VVSSLQVSRPKFWIHFSSFSLMRATFPFSSNFRSLGRCNQSVPSPRPCVTFRNRLVRCGLALPKPQAGGPPLAGCSASAYSLYSQLSSICGLGYRLDGRRSVPVRDGDLFATASRAALGYTQTSHRVPGAVSP
jgi:hypothetical protein